MYSNEIVCNILIYINENINSKISIEDLERKFFYNRYYIMKLFKKELNISIVDYINSLRVYNSILKIRDTRDKLLSIALKSGFNSIEYFSEILKKFVGVNPQIIKKYYKNKNSVELKQIETINNSMIELYYINQIKDKYLLNKKPKILPQKKLSIFKQKSC